MAILLIMDQIPEWDQALEVAMGREARVTAMAPRATIQEVNMVREVTTPEAATARVLTEVDHRIIVIAISTTEITRESTAAVTPAWEHG